jgi:hypothetical protein
LEQAACHEPQLYIHHPFRKINAGTGLAKRTMEVRIVDGNKIGLHGLTISEKGRKLRRGLFGGDGALQEYREPRFATRYGEFVPEGARTLVRSGKGPLFEKYEKLPGRMNKRKSAVAVARKMVGLAWLLMKRRDCYHGVNSAVLEKKSRYCKIKKIAEEAVSAWQNNIGPHQRHEQTRRLPNVRHSFAEIRVIR